MQLNNMMLVKVVVLISLVVGFTATVDARFDASSLVTQVLNQGDADIIPSYFVKSSTTACCDKCVCTRSIPPQCQCRDIGETCHSACKSCICTRSIPPQCRCTDVTDFCYPPCNSSESGPH